MQIEILNQTKNEVELKIDNLTIAEILRVYLNKEKVEFAAWRKEHPSKPIIFKIITSSKTLKKSISDAISALKKDLDNIASLAKKE